MLHVPKLSLVTNKPAEKRALLDRFTVNFFLVVCFWGKSSITVTVRSIRT
jgi:hypothetical protein